MRHSRTRVPEGVELRPPEMIAPGKAWLSGPMRGPVSKAIEVVRSPLLLGALAAATIVGIGSSFLDPSYRADGLLFPQVTGPQSSNFASIAARFGLGSFTGGLSLSFYSDVLTSRSVLDSLLVRRYEALKAGNLLDDLGIADGEQAERLEHGSRVLREGLAISPDEPAGLLQASVEASSPELAVEVLDSLLAIANRAVATALITQASYQREYLEQRLEDARREMAQKEAVLERFYSDNRTYQQSPTLVLRETTLRREVEIARDIYGTIRQEYEQARMSEARDVPTLSFVSAPAMPHKPASPKPLRNAVLMLFAVMSIGIALRLLRTSTHDGAPDFSA